MTALESKCKVIFPPEVLERNLLALFPEIAKEWHPVLNKFAPRDCSPFSGRKVWWVCSHGHEYESKVGNRTIKGSGCPYCAGHKVCRENSLSSLFPNVASQWDTDKNLIRPDEVTSGSDKKVWWKCENGHSWKTAVYLRTQLNRPTGCPFCKRQYSAFEIRVLSEMTVVFGNVEWGYRLKGRECDVFLRDIKVGVEVDGSFWHKGKEERDKRKNNFFAKYGITIIRLREEPLPLLGDMDVGYNYREDQLCVVKRLVDTISRISGRQTTYGCQSDFINTAYYTGLLSKVSLQKKSLANEFPSIAARWHPSKNGLLTPDRMAYGSERKVWWVCEKGHEWMATPNRLTSRIGNGTGCPWCDGKQVSADNSFAFRHPDLAERWHPFKNGQVTPNDVTRSSGRYIWWRCPSGHDYGRRVNNMVHKNSACAVCHL